MIKECENCGDVCCLDCDGCKRDAEGCGSCYCGGEE